MSCSSPGEGEERGYRLDGQGSVRLLLDTAQREVLSTYRYDPFGRLLAGDTSNTRRYTGEQQDTSGLYYLRARYYDPATGRFLTRDPFPGLATWPATQQPYAYALNNPLKYADPSGKSSNALGSSTLGCSKLRCVTPPRRPPVWALVTVGLLLTTTTAVIEVVVFVPAEAALAGPALAGFPPLFSSS